MSDVGGGDWPVGMIRVQAIWQAMTGLPEDRFVNTFHFRSTTTVDAAVLEAAADRVREFYYGDHSGTSSTPLVQWMPASSIDASKSELRVYDLVQPAPREPAIFGMDGTLGAGAPLPSEVAMCLSYYSQRNIPRQRGRIYLGPLLSNANFEAGDGQSRPHNSLRDSALAAGQWLGGSDTLEWVVASQAGADPVGRRITDVWCDNAWDTQRRRGVAATGRFSAEVL